MNSAQISGAAATFRLTSLLLVEERVREAEYFIARLREHGDPITFGYDLNAFLSSARSVTFLLQKELAKVPGFGKWWAGQQDVLRKDKAARFFLELRNFSQKEGRIGMIGSGSARSRRWCFIFADTPSPVPLALRGREVADCCQEHLSKLARLVLACSDVFPWYSCPTRVLTDEAVAALEMDLDSIDVALGFPAGWTDLGERSGRIAVLRQQFKHDAVDFDYIRRVGTYQPPAASVDDENAIAFSERFAAEIRNYRAEGATGLQASRTAFIAASMKKDAPDT